MSILSALKAQPDVEIHLAPSAVEPTYRYWRKRILLSSLLGYATFYFVRTNIGQAIPAMQKTLGYSKAQLGFILTVGGVVYGVSKFINGFLGDRANPRYFMAIGLAICGLMNIFFGLSSSLMMLAALWFLNNWGQGMGFPPCARNMGYWFSPKERSTTFGMWHTGHMIGAALVSVLTGYLVRYFGWRSCFFVPAGIAFAGTLFILNRLRDTPGSMGLPPVEIYKGEESQADLDRETGEGLSYLQVVVEQVFKNPYMWIISLANFFVYTLRIAGLHWGPTQLQEMKHLSIVASGWVGSGSEICGLVSALVAGYVTDRYFKGRAGRVCVIATLSLTVAVYLFWSVQNAVLASICFLVMGFMVYVPQMLIAAMAMNLGTKRAGAAAVGLTGIFAYASTVLSGWGVGKIVDAVGWNGAFYMLVACSLVTTVLMALTWNVGAHADVMAADVATTGDGDRAFCPNCGSRTFNDRCATCHRALELATAVVPDRIGQGE
jgi:sugar phosphate permease